MEKPSVSYEQLQQKVKDLEKMSLQQAEAAKEVKTMVITMCQLMIGNCLNIDEELSNIKRGCKGMLQYFNPPQQPNKKTPRQELTDGNIEQP